VAASDTTVGRRSVAIAAAISAVLGLWGIGNKSLWVDEAISLASTKDLVTAWRGTGGTMALYYALLRPWALVSDSPAWIRSLSLAFTLAALPFIWSCARRAFNHSVASIAVVITASMPLTVRYSQEARSYALVLLLSSIGWCALLATNDADEADDPRSAKRWMTVYLVVSAISPLAHGLSILQFIAQGCFVALSPQRQMWIARLKVPFIAAVATSGTLTALGASDIASWIPPISLSQFVELAEVLTSANPVAMVAMVALIAVGTWQCWKRFKTATDPKARWMSLLPIIWGLVPIASLILISFARPYLLARYVVASGPALAMLITFAILGPSASCQGVASVPNPQASNFSVRQFAVSVIIIVALVVGQVALHREPGDDWQGATAVVGTETKLGDALVFTNPPTRIPFDAAWDLHDPSGLTPEPFSPVEPVGKLRRFYTIRDPDNLASEMVDSDFERFWVLSQKGIGFDDSLTPFLQESEISDSFTVVQNNTLDGGVQVALLERK